MTPERKRALQWFHDRGEVHRPWEHDGCPSIRMIRRMLDEQQLGWTARYGHALTDKGRRMLHGDMA